MIIDDNSINIMIIQKFFEMLPKLSNVKIVTAQDGQEAYTLFVKNATSFKISLILTDCEMPIMNGYECVKQIRDYE